MDILAYTVIAIELAIGCYFGWIIWVDIIRG
jgi:hypothetical protein